MAKWTWDKIAFVIDELKKMNKDEFNYTELLAFIEKSCLVGEQTARLYIKMMLRHGLINRIGMYIFSIPKEKKEEKKEEVKEIKEEVKEVKDDVRKEGESP